MGQGSVASPLSLPHAAHELWALQTGFVAPPQLTPALHSLQAPPTQALAVGPKQDAPPPPKFCAQATHVPELRSQELVAPAQSGKKSPAALPQMP